uniref:Uncharacterized protein n=1 Tax=viral metagenome TaxID=1070528 RepID=A0A6C0BLT1_9ZZZZ
MPGKKKNAQKPNAAPPNTKKPGAQPPKQKEESLTPTLTADFSDAGLECELLVRTVEETLKHLDKQQNLHLVLRELRHLILEVGRCCDPYDDEDDYTDSSSRDQVFWEKLQDHVLRNQVPKAPRPPKAPFQAPTPAKATAHGTAKVPLKKAPAKVSPPKN